MRFGRWYPLGEASEHAPAAPGVFQVRVASGLIQYPTGKSAMIHYAAATDLRAAIQAFAATHWGSDWLCRHSEDAAEPTAACDTLIERFTRQFGTPPMLPGEG